MTPVDLTEIEALIDLLGDTPLFVRKEVAPKSNGHASAFEREAFCLPGSKALDVEAPGRKAF